MTWCSECGEAHFSTQHHRCKPGARLKTRLELVWNNEAPLRYRPRAVEGGPGWQVWDAVENRLLSDAEVVALSCQSIRSETIRH